MYYRVNVLLLQPYIMYTCECQIGEVSIKRFATLGAHEDVQVRHCYTVNCSQYIVLLNGT